MIKADRYGCLNCIVVGNFEEEGVIEVSGNTRAMFAKTEDREKQKRCLLSKMQVQA